MKHSIVLDILISALNSRADVSFGNPLEASIIDQQIRSTHRWSVNNGMPERVPNMVQNVLNQRISGFEDILVSDDFRNFHPKKLFRVVFSVLSKNALSQNTEMRFTPVEIHFLWKVYRFLLTEDGKQLLHDGILSMMDLSFDGIDVQDLEDLYNVHGITNRETCEKLGSKMNTANRRIQNVISAFRYVEDYIRELKKVLLAYHKREMEDAKSNLEQNIKSGGDMGHRRVFHATYERNADALSELGMEFYIVQYS